MTAQTFTVTHPNGQQDTRTSKTRTYTHAVVLVTVDAEKRAAHYDALIPGAFHEQTADWYRARAAKIRANGNGHRVTVRWSSSEANAVKAATSGELVKGLDLNCERLEVVAVDAN